MNKVDLFPNGGVDDPALQTQVKKLRAKFKHTKFGPYLPIVPVAAAPRPSGGDGGEGENPGAGKEEAKQGHGVQAPPASYGIDDLINTILQKMEVPNRDNQKGQHF